MAAARKLKLQMVTKDGVYENGGLVSSDYLKAIDAEKMNLFLYMLRELAIKSEDLEKISSGYLDTLPAATRDVLVNLKIAADPSLPQPTPQMLDILAESAGGRTAEFKRIANEIRHGRVVVRAEENTTEITPPGIAVHEHLGISEAAYGDGAKLAGYVQTEGKLDARMKSDGYSFFALIDEENNKLVALASGNAAKLGSNKANDQSQFRLLNIVVHPDYLKDDEGKNNHYGRELLARISDYAAQPEQGYDKIVMPLSISALAKGNPGIYLATSEHFANDTPSIEPHENDPMSISLSFSPKRLITQQVEKRPATWALQ